MKQHEHKAGCYMGELWGTVAGYGLGLWLLIRLMATYMRQRYMMEYEWRCINYKSPHSSLVLSSPSYINSYLV